MVDSGTFTKAAGALRMTQSGVSHAIAGLESEIGVSLIERDRGGVRPTEVGGRVLVHAREALGLIERVGEEASGSRELESGTLRIGSFPSAASRLLPALMGSFKDRYPGVEVVLVEGTDQEVHNWIRSRAVDVGFVTLPTEGLETVEVGKDEMLAVVPEGHALTSEERVSVGRLAKEPFVMSTGGCEPLILAAFRSAGCVPQTRFEVKEVGTILAMVGERLGITIVPELALPHDLESLPGVCALPLDPPVRRRLALAVRSFATASPAAAAFVEQAKHQQDRGRAKRFWASSSVCIGNSHPRGVKTQAKPSTLPHTVREKVARSMSPGEIREKVRSGEYAGPTSGFAREYVQTNLVILPEEYAFDFLKFCVRNPKSCPVLEVTDTGSPNPPVMAPEADLRTDAPKYRVYREGELVDEPTEVGAYWSGELVSFLIGCSFTFESALLDAGLRLAHLDQGRNVPMYVTNRECVPSGPFSGPMVVSMRPYRAEEVPRAMAVSARYPTMHGAPVHVGDPEALGVRDLDAPEFGDPVFIEANEIPVFWACGVTPQAAAMDAKPAMMITHSPGHMFVTDLSNSEYEV